MAHLLADTRLTGQPFQKACIRRARSRRNDLDQTRVSTVLTFALGYRGDLGPGDVQWMTAARGIVHSEMPQQTEGRMRGFQLWINLPANEKMKAASYRDIRASEIPQVKLPGVTARFIAGTLISHQGTDQSTTTGPIQGLSTEPLYFDVTLDANSQFEVPIPAGHNVFVYVYEGAARTGEQAEVVEAHSAGLLSDGDRVFPATCSTRPFQAIHRYPRVRLIARRISPGCPTMICCPASGGGRVDNMAAQ